MKGLKSREKIALLSTAIGIAAGFGLAWLLPDANTWLYIIVGFLVAISVNYELYKSATKKSEQSEN